MVVTKIFEFLNLSSFHKMLNNMYDEKNNNLSQDDIKCIKKYKMNECFYNIQIKKLIQEKITSEMKQQLNNDYMIVFSYKGKWFPDDFIIQDIVAVKDINEIYVLKCKNDNLFWIDKDDLNRMESPESVYNTQCCIWSLIVITIFVIVCWILIFLRILLPHLMDIFYTSAVVAAQKMI